MLFAYLLQQNVFPDRGTVYDFYFVKQASGSWNNWIDRVDKAKNVIPKDAKVNMGYPVNNSNGQLLPTQLFSSVTLSHWNQLSSASRSCNFENKFLSLISQAADAVIAYF